MSAKIVIYSVTTKEIDIFLKFFIILFPFGWLFHVFQLSCLLKTICSIASSTYHGWRPFHWCCPLCHTILRGQASKNGTAMEWREESPAHFPVYHSFTDIPQWQPSAVRTGESWKSNLVFPSISLLVTSWLTASSLGLPFLGWARRKRSEHLPESLRADSPTWLSSPHSIPERAFLNGGSQPWSLRDADGKTFWHTTFRISRIVQVRREDYGKLSAYGQSPQECVGMYRQMMNICPFLQTYTCFMGLPSTLFSIHLNECSLSFFLVNALYSTHSTRLQSDPWTFAGISVRPLDTFPWQR